MISEILFYLTGILIFTLIIRYNRKNKCTKCMKCWKNI